MKFTVKKFLFALLFLCAVTMNAFALQNSLGQYISSPEYNQFLATVKNSEMTRAQVDAAYQQFLQDIPYGYPQARGTYDYTLYLTEQKDKAAANKAVDYMTQIMNTLPEGFEKQTLNLDILCMKCNLERTLSLGLKLQDVIKAYYETWASTEVYASLVEAYRYHNTPGIAGGSSKKAVEIFGTLIPVAEAEEDILKPELRFSLYMGLLESNYSLKNWAEAKIWCDKANEIFPKNGELMDYTKKLASKLGK